jgi:tRNA pseudouridine38-40 synthase
VTSWKLGVEYDGTEFAGWQIQPEARTVQAELDRALSTVLRREIRVQGAGRTDAGVHALGQVASFAIDDGVDVARSVYGVNCVLPDDVVIRTAEVAPDGFHARFDAIRRHYRYRLHRGPVAVERRTCLVVHPLPDVEAMRRAAARVVGDRDFASFASSPEPGESTRCAVERCEVVSEGRFVNVEVTANRFLRKMVRTLVGTLLEVGWGKHPPEWIDDVLAARDRAAAGPVIAPTGLFLAAVDYPEVPPDEEA